MVNRTFPCFFSPIFLPNWLSSSDVAMLRLLRAVTIVVATKRSLPVMVTAMGVASARYFLLPYFFMKEKNKTRKQREEEKKEEIKEKKEKKSKEKEKEFLSLPSLH